MIQTFQLIIVFIALAYLYLCSQKTALALELQYIFRWREHFELSSDA